LYGAIVIEESPGQAPPEDIARVLLEHVRPVAHRVFGDFEAAQTLLCRIEWLRKIGYALPQLAMPELLQAACEGCRSFGDLEAVSLCALIREQISGVDVERLAPERLLLGNRQAPITYPEDGDPYISSRMQDFFGMSDGPRIANGRPLILHLLAPSSRPVQLTSDLKGFWARHYPAIRKELMRQYPRHAWPEDPLDPDSIAAARPVPRRN
jgi:ATP-dependent helicase HrpB